MKQEKEKQADIESVEVDSETYPGQELEGNFGWCGVEPKWLQCMNNPFGFSVIYTIILITQGMLANGIFNVIISTLEQRFGFTSSEMGIITVSYDIGYLLFALFVTFYGNRGHRPRLMALGSILLGLGSLLFAIPHFATDPYEYGESTSNLCQLNKTDGCSDQDKNVRSYFYLFIFAMFLEGIGCIPFFTVSYAILEDSLPKTKSPLYMSWANAMSILGPVIGYVLGGYILTIYVDFHVPGVSTDDKSPSDPRWVGAWWLGHLLVAALCFFVIMIPMFGFPRQFPGSAKVRALRDSEVHAKSGIEITNNEDFGKSFRDMPQAMLVLVKNPTYILTVLAGCSEGFIVSGFTAFLPKFIENQYNASPAMAAAYAGLIAIPGGLFGNLFAGIVVSKFNLRTPQLLNICIACVLTVLALSPIAYYHCPDPIVAGVTVGYTGNEMPEEVELQAMCNQDCNCGEEFFTPVCQGNFSYFSACHAGCSSYNDTSETYSNCGCLGDGVVLKDGLCEQECNAIIPFITVFFVIVMASFGISTPGTLTILRTVPEGQRSFATGFQVTLMRLLGSIPGPLIFGVIFDSTCILWEEQSCPPGRGSCYIYDSNQLAINLTVMAMSFKVLSIALFYLAKRLYKTSDDATGEKMDDLNSFDMDNLSTFDNLIKNKTFAEEKKDAVSDGFEKHEAQLTEL